MGIITTNQIVPGMTLKIQNKVYRVESAIKMTVAKGSPFIKAKLRDLSGDTVIEKNFKFDQNIEEVFLKEHELEYLYPEGERYLFLDVDLLEKVLVPAEILVDTIQYLKESIRVKAFFYSDTVFSVELPQFLELMVVKTEEEEGKGAVTGCNKKAVMETGAVIDVPLFVETGDVIKVDTQTGEYVQRV